LAQIISRHLLKDTVKLEEIRKLFSWQLTSRLRVILLRCFDVQYEYNEYEMKVLTKAIIIDTCAQRESGIQTHLY
jgi:hypothetical protein